MSKILKKIETKILEVELKHQFVPSWYAIFFNPFFISRWRLFKRLHFFSSSFLPNSRILDVGCGIKPYSSLFINSHYEGIEIKGGGHKERAKSPDKYYDGTNIPYEDSVFDYIISTEVFEHVENLENLVKEIHRTLKVGGTLFITTPFVWPEHEIPYDFRRLTTYGHKRLLEMNGFKIESIQKTTGIFGTFGQLLSEFLNSSLFSIIDRMSSTGMRYKIKFILFRLINLFICAPIQIFFILLDVLFSHRGITLDYVVKAKKI